MGDQRDSNPRPPAPQAGALPLSYGHQVDRNKLNDYNLFFDIIF